MPFCLKRSKELNVTAGTILHLRGTCLFRKEQGSENLGRAVSLTCCPGLAGHLRTAVARLWLLWSKGVQGAGGGLRNVSPENACVLGMDTLWICVEILPLRACRLQMTPGASLLWQPRGRGSWKWCLLEGCCRRWWESPGLESARPGSRSLTPGPAR